jgi:hypothetical protein
MLTSACKIRIDTGQSKRIVYYILLVQRGFCESVFDTHKSSENVERSLKFWQKFWMLVGCSVPNNQNIFKGSGRVPLCKLP